MIRELVWLRPENSTNVIIPSTGHLIPHERPRELGTWLTACSFRHTDASRHHCSFRALRILAAAVHSPVAEPGKTVISQYLDENHHRKSLIS